MGKMSEERKDIDKLLEIVDKMLEDVSIRKVNNKANAYTVRLTDTYAITLRDEFNKLDGEDEALIEVKNNILKLINEGDKNNI
jgi:hypothetical protein